MRSHTADRTSQMAVALALLAVVLAAGGGDAIAQGANALLKKGSVKSRHIANGTIKPVDLDPAVGLALTGAAGGQLEGPLTNLQLREDAVGARQIIVGGVGTSEIAEGAVTSAKVPDDALTGSDINEATLNFPSASSQRTATDGQNSITADLGSLGLVTLNCLDNAQQGRISIYPPPADTTPINVAAELTSEGDPPTVLGDRLAAGGTPVSVDTATDATATQGFSGKVTIARVGDVSQHIVVEVAGATRLGGGDTCWLDMELTR